MEWDHQLFLYLNGLFNIDWATAFFKITTDFGHGMVQAALIIPTMFFFSRKKFKQHLLPLALTAAIGGILVSGIKVGVGRTRPFAHYNDNASIIVHAPQKRLPRDTSFPSGHTQTAFSTATYLSILYPALTPLFALLAIITGLSRIALGVHFPLDVFVGAALGIAMGILGYKLNMRRLNRGESRDS